MGLCMVFRMIALKVLVRLHPEEIGMSLGHAVLKTPNSVLIPAIKIGRFQANILHKIPVVRNVDITRIPLVGPVLMGVQTALAARAAVDAAKQAMDPFAHGMVTVYSPMPFDSAVSTAGRHLLDSKSETLSGVGTGASFLAAQAQSLGGKLEKPAAGEEAPQDLTLRTRTSTFIP